MTQNNSYTYAINDCLDERIIQGVWYLHIFWTMENNSQTNGKLQIFNFNVKIDSHLVTGIGNVCANFEIEKSKGTLT